jgi:hypothetical protein
VCGLVVLSIQQHQAGGCARVAMRAPRAKNSFRAAGAGQDRRQYVGAGAWSCTPVLRRSSPSNSFVTDTCAQRRSLHSKLWYQGATGQACYTYRVNRSSINPGVRHPSSMSPPAHPQRKRSLSSRTVGNSAQSTKTTTRTFSSELYEPTLRHRRTTHEALPDGPASVSCTFYKTRASKASSLVHVISGAGAARWARTRTIDYGAA